MKEAIISRKQPSITVPLAEAARRLGVTPQTLRSWKDRGYILCAQLPNGRYVVPQTEIERLQSNTSEVIGAE